MNAIKTVVTVMLLGHMVNVNSESFFNINTVAYINDTVQCVDFQRYNFFDIDVVVFMPSEL